MKQKNLELDRLVFFSDAVVAIAIYLKGGYQYVVV